MTSQSAPGRSNCLVFHKLCQLHPGHVPDQETSDIAQLASKYGLDALDVTVHRSATSVAYCVPCPVGSGFGAINWYCERGMLARDARASFDV